MGDGTGGDGLHRVQVGVGVGDPVRILQDIGHFFEQNAIFPLDFSVPL